MNDVDLAEHLILIQVAWDEEAQKKFLLCDYNRDGDAHR
jgi:hypothetical protein